MRWTTPSYSRGRVDAAGKVLIKWDSVPFDEFDDALVAIDNWRASHGYPLQALKMNLLRRARSVDASALVAQRLKRLSSITIKLRRNPNMQLSQMQDIGGCRAVVRSVGRVVALAKRYEASTERSILVEKYDYVEHPKSDGYRGIHLVYKYQSPSPPQSLFNNLRIEIQLRSRLQHAWATAVETVDTFTKQALKVGSGSKDWARFFALMGSAIAMRERKAPVPGTPTDAFDLIEELKGAADHLRVEQRLTAWANAIRRLPGQDTGGARVYLLQLDPDANSMKVTGFKTWTGAKASDAYLKAEKKITEDATAQAVLVSVQSLQALRSAYPNYFADTRAFIRALQRALSSLEMHRQKRLPL